jgi:aspartyl protease/PDZ domain-containing protein
MAPLKNGNGKYGAGLRDCRLLMVGILACAAVSAALAGCARPESRQAQIGKRSKLTSVPFYLFRGNRILLQGRLNGTESQMILDNGAKMTVVDRDFAASLGLRGDFRIKAEGMGNTAEVEVIESAVIEVGNLQLTTVVAILDLAPVSNAIGTPIDVVLGREALLSGRVSIDFGRSRITMSNDKDFIPPRHAIKLKLKREGNAHFAPITIFRSSPTMALIDLGNGGALSLCKEYQERLPRIAKLPTASGMGHGVAGRRELTRTTLPRVKFGGHEFRDVPTDLDGLHDGSCKAKANVGIQMFRPFIVTLDLGHDRLWLQRTEKPVDFMKDRSGLVTLLKDDTLIVVFVSPGSPGDRAGLRKGDVVIFVDGTRVTSSFFFGSDAAWANRPSGTKVQLIKENGETVTLTLADYY